MIYVVAMLPFGERETFFVPEITELRDQRHDVIVVPVRPRGQVVHSDAKRVEPFAIREPLLSLNIVSAMIVELFRNPLGLAKIVKTLFKSRNRHVLFNNLAVLPKGVWLARLARECGSDHIHAQWASTPSTVAFIASELTSIPWSFTAHRWDIPENNLLREKVASAAFVRAIDEKGAEEIAKIAAPVDGNVVVLHLGVTLPAVNRRSETAQPRPVALMAANLVEKKGHKYLIEAMLLLKERGVDVAIELAGSGPLRAELEEKIRECRLEDRVRLLGLIPHEQLIERMQRGEWMMFVLPSIETDGGETEGIPVSLMEAMAAGVPVIASSIGGIPELLRDGAGVLVAQKSVEALANTIQTIAGSETLRNMYRVAGRKRVESEFELKRQVSRLVQRCAGASAETIKGELTEMAAR